jgi:hypothetical protein
MALETKKKSGKTSSRISLDWLKGKSTGNYGFY